MKKIKFATLTKTEKELLLEAERMMTFAYNPYSHFFVGAAILTATGEMIGGANVENAAYGSCICAERSALVRANAMGFRNLRKIAIMAKGEKSDTKVATGPCGSCRQMIYEAAQVAGCDLDIIMASSDKKQIIKAKISELLPLAFGPLDLGISVKKYR